MNKIYVGNLTYSTTEQHLEELFNQFGSISDLVIIRDKFTDRSKGFGFITFEDEKAAQEALSLDGQDFQGRNLNVKIAKPKENSGSGRRDR